MKTAYALVAVLVSIFSCKSAPAPAPVEIHPTPAAAPAAPTSAPVAGDVPPVRPVSPTTLQWPTSEAPRSPPSAAVLTAPREPTARDAAKVCSRGDCFDARCLKALKVRYPEICIWPPGKTNPDMNGGLNPCLDDFTECP
jgi:hypothetical protein